DQTVDLCRGHQPQDRRDDNQYGSSAPGNTWSAAIAAHSRWRDSQAYGACAWTFAQSPGMAGSGSYLVPISGVNRSGGLFVRDVHLLGACECGRKDRRIANSAESGIYARYHIRDEQDHIASLVAGNLFDRSGSDVRISVLSVPGKREAFRFAGSYLRAAHDVQ